MPIFCKKALVNKIFRLIFATKAFYIVDREFFPYSPRGGRRARKKTTNALHTLYICNFLLYI